jgi:hypothetical protein
VFWRYRPNTRAKPRAWRRLSRTVVALWSRKRDERTQQRVIEAWVLRQCFDSLTIGTQPRWGCVVPVVHFPRLAAHGNSGLRAFRTQPRWGCVVPVVHFPRVVAAHDNPGLRAFRTQPRWGCVVPLAHFPRVAADGNPGLRAFRTQPRWGCVVPLVHFPRVAADGNPGLRAATPSG